MFFLFVFFASWLFLLLWNQQTTAISLRCRTILVPVTALYMVYVRACAQGRPKLCMNVFLVKALKGLVDLVFPFREISFQYTNTHIVIMETLSSFQPLQVNIYLLSYWSTAKLFLLCFLMLTNHSTASLSAYSYRMTHSPSKSLSAQRSHCPSLLPRFLCICVSRNVQDLFNAKINKSQNNT